MTAFAPHPCPFPNEAHRRPYGTLPDGTAIELYVLRSSHLEVSVCTFGARVVDLLMREENGAWASVVLTLPTLDDYIADRSYMGATIGRFANRIAKGCFEVGSRQYRVSRNEGEHSLHGGQQGFDQRVWVARLAQGCAIFEYTSPSGEEGYPGSLCVTVRYAVSGRELHLTYDAQSGAETPVNLTNHMYFNLGGRTEEDVLSHVVTLPADLFTPVDATLIPTGDLTDVQGTPFDFREAHAIGERIDLDEPQLRLAQGYDHNWVLSKLPGVLGLAAQVYEPRSNRRLTVSTTEPAVQFYTGNHLGTVSDTIHPAHGYRCGFCLETQHFPDSPNRPAFPSTLLKPGESYRSHTLYRLDSHTSI